MAQGTPKGFRLHVGLLGRRNVGKSSLINALSGQRSAIVSEQAGTTTDPVFRPVELQPIGPVLLIDTAGLDDEGALGLLRVERTRRLLDRLDLALLVTEAGCWGETEERLLGELQSRSTPVVVVTNKADRCGVSQAPLDGLEQRSLRTVATVATTGQGLDELREALIELAPEDVARATPLVSDLVPPGEVALLVVPIDKEAPKGRLILPQAQTIRDLLDAGRLALVTRDDELTMALASLARPAALVITDSQALARVAANTPDEVSLTTFSVLFSRFKGDLRQQVRGAVALSRLGRGARVLIAEACTHHPITDDIATVKIPRLLADFVGASLHIDHCRGHDLPEELARYDLVVHCGACVWNRREMLSRIRRCSEVGVPITNYGLTIACCLDLLERVIRPFVTDGSRLGGEHDVPGRIDERATP